MGGDVRAAGGNVMRPSVHFEAAFGQERLANCQEVCHVDSKNGDRRAPERSFSNEHRVTPGKMLRPFVSSWMKEWYEGCISRVEAR